MISAKWLFEKHRNHLAMAAFYEEELKRLEIEKDEIIEGRISFESAMIDCIESHLESLSFILPE